MKKSLVTAIVIIFVLCLCVSLYFGWVGVISLIVFIITLTYLRFKFIQRIGGVTGDTIGASIEISELSSLMAFVIGLHYWAV